MTELKTRNSNFQSLENSQVQELKQKRQARYFSRNRSPNSRQVLVSDRIKLAQLIEEVIAGEDKLISNSDLDEKSISDLRNLEQVKCELIQSLREIGKLLACRP